MRHTFLALVGVIALTTGTPAQQGRPDLAGRWSLANPAPAAGPSQSTLVIGQTGDQFTVEQQVFAIRFEPAVNATRETGGSVRSTYITDGADHDVPVLSAPATGPSIKSTYRALWTGSQLVVMRHDSTVFTRRDDSQLTIRRVVRQAFMLDKDGTLAVDSLTVEDPLPPGFFFNQADVTPETPVNQRSVYHRAQ